MDCSTKNSHHSIITLIFINLVKHGGMDSFKVSRLENMWTRNLPNCMYRDCTLVVAIVDTLLTDMLHLYVRSRFRRPTHSRTSVMKSSSMGVLSFHTRSQKFCVQFPLSSVDHTLHIGSLSCFAC